MPSPRRQIPGDTTEKDIREVWDSWTHRQLHPLCVMQCSIARTLISCVTYLLFRSQYLNCLCGGDSAALDTLIIEYRKIVPLVRHFSLSISSTLLALHFSYIPQYPTPHTPIPHTHIHTPHPTPHLLHFTLHLNPTPQYSTSSYSTFRILSLPTGCMVTCSRLVLS